MALAGNGCDKVGINPAIHFMQPRLDWHGKGGSKQGRGDSLPQLPYVSTSSQTQSTWGHWLSAFSPLPTVLLQNACIMENGGRQIKEM